MIFTRNSSAYKLLGLEH